MTKKFWNDWQNRIGETKNIYLSKSYYKVLRDKDKLIKATFHDDAVDLIIERHNWVISYTSAEHWHIENEYLTLHRDEIATIEFI